ncbi:hypothetical protein DDB_G0292604 [Dictyostelium discoideum AX4]|uniref:Ribosomal protein/NADH dehydrogenase domain-containing protein n=1 Tax=Dictyostelium discoideum TaxID=44689 RepID=Q54D02_DICDI|nr:hypothetical protein DDB_G0292604 [Dictyostelium discoideum AX4]EAL61105.1 hypothetical protein DDB_G0292604 [Dictyostelium discoideum AX4]|eukprot:XP_629518.1 hypothetical protein DDB_G0292604 [Dictyostelium discoideum AX4]
MQRFYKFLNIEKPMNHSELLKAFSMQKIYLHDAKKVTILTSKKGGGLSAPRIFKYKFLEPIIFWNKDVHFEYQKKFDTEPRVLVENLNGSEHTIPINSKNADQILEEILRATNGKRVDVNIPI